MTKYDVGVIGYNINGLATAALLAKSGRSVMLFPHHEESLQNNNSGHLEFPFFYSWDCANGAFCGVIQQLELETQISCRPSPMVDKLKTPLYELERPYGWESFGQLLLSRYPKEKESLFFYLQEMKELGIEWQNILRAESIFKVKSVRKTLEYRNTIYLDFVRGLFESEELISLLTANMPRSGVALTVMAGYLTTQLFDYHQVDGGKAEIFRRLEESLLDSEGVLAREPIGNIVNSGLNAFMIHGIDGSQVECRSIVSTFDERMTCQTYFPDILIQNPGFPVQQKILAPFTVALQLKPGFNFDSITSGFALYYYSQLKTSEIIRQTENGRNLEVNAFRIYPDRAQNRLVVQMDISPLGDSAADDQALAGALITAVNQIEPVTGWIQAQEIYGPKRMERITGYHQGFWNRWAFLPEEMAANPLESKTFLPGLFTTGQWGGAWFTAALAVARSVQKIFR